MSEAEPTMECAACARASEEWMKGDYPDAGSSWAAMLDANQRAHHAEIATLRAEIAALLATRNAGLATLPVKCPKCGHLWIEHEGPDKGDWKVGVSSASPYCVGDNSCMCDGAEWRPFIIAAAAGLTRRLAEAEDLVRIRLTRSLLFDAQAQVDWHDRAETLLAEEPKEAEP